MGINKHGVKLGQSLLGIVFEHSFTHGSSRDCLPCGSAASDPHMRALTAHHPSPAKRGYTYPPNFADEETDAQNVPQFALKNQTSAMTGLRRAQKLEDSSL